ncbi:hypothetical protein BR93DRAFT_928653 [Coniochaeta sp. PMI_546]|nr:hypothetical protein BR93DRAFT_928653 [Coniochaeta sp. PMI_546]
MPSATLLPSFISSISSTHSHHKAIYEAIIFRPHIPDLLYHLLLAIFSFFLDRQQRET